MLIYVLNIFLYRYENDYDVTLMYTYFSLLYLFFVYTLDKTFDCSSDNDNLKFISSILGFLGFHSKKLM